MADTIKNHVLSDSDERYAVHLTGVSDGTGESAVIKVDKSTLLALPYGTAAAAEPVSLDIEQIRWAIQGFSYIKLHWDHTTDDTAMLLCGSGYDDFRGEGGMLGNRTPRGLADPRSSGDTGDLLLTSVGAASGATYDITLWLRKTNK